MDVNEHQMNMQAPSNKGKIRVKALRLPKDIKLKAIPKTAGI